MRKELKKLLQEFLEETESSRTEYSSEHDIPTIKAPTFADLINWLNLE